MDKKSEEYLRQYIKLTDTMMQHLKMEKMSWMSILKCWKPELI